MAGGRGQGATKRRRKRIVVDDAYIPAVKNAIPAGEKGVVCFTVDERDQSVFVICVTYAGANWAARIKERNE